MFLEISKIWDAVVIGAGPAGSVSAIQLARQGFNVLLVDKAQFPRDKVCGCCLSGKAINALSQLDLSKVYANGVLLILSPWVSHKNFLNSRSKVGLRFPDIRLTNN